MTETAEGRPGASGGGSGAAAPATGYAASADELALLRALRNRDEPAFATLVTRYHSSLVRLARTFVQTAAAAEDVAQETWLAVLQGLDRFEGRSSLKTWIFRILINRAKTRFEREGRYISFATLADVGADEPEPAVDPSQFLPPDHPYWPGHWGVRVQRWGRDAETKLLAKEAHRILQSAIEALPSSQRTVITLRDIEGVSSEEVCNVLEISETNQRVLLHRARSKVRKALEDYFATG